MISTYNVHCLADWLLLLCRRSVLLQHQDFRFDCPASTFPVVNAMSMFCQANRSASQNTENTEKTLNCRFRGYMWVSLCSFSFSVCFTSWLEASGDWIMEKFPAAWAIHTFQPGEPKIFCLASARICLLMSCRLSLRTGEPAIKSKFTSKDQCTNLIDFLQNQLPFLSLLLPSPRDTCVLARPRESRVAEQKRKLASKCV